MIYDQYVHIHKAVPPSEWGDWENGDEKGGLVATISKKINIHKNSYNCTRRIMKEIFMCVRDKVVFNPNRRKRDNVTQYGIKPGSMYEIMCCQLLEEGNPASLVADLISVCMQSDGINKSVSRQSVHTVIDRLNPITNIVKNKAKAVITKKPGGKQGTIGCCTSLCG